MSGGQTRVCHRKLLGNWTAGVDLVQVGWTGSLEPGDSHKHRQTERQTERQAEPVEGVTQVDRGRWTQVYTGTS